MNGDPKVIVVIGSVTNKEYQELRLKYVREGVKTRIVRITDDYIEDIRMFDVYDEMEEDDSDVPDGEIYSATLITFCEQNGFTFDSVVEVIVHEEEWIGAGDSAMDYAFSDVFTKEWPNLKSVTVIDRNGMIRQR